MSTLFFSTEIFKRSIASEKRQTHQLRPGPSTTPRRALIHRKLCAAFVELTDAEAKVESSRRRRTMVRRDVTAANGTMPGPWAMRTCQMAGEFVAGVPPSHQRKFQAPSERLKSRRAFWTRYAPHPASPMPCDALGSRLPCRAAFGSRVPVQEEAEIGCGVRRSERLKSSRALWTRYAAHPASPRPGTPWAVSAHAGQPTAAAHRCRRRLKSAVACGEANG